MQNKPEIQPPRKSSTIKFNRRDSLVKQTEKIPLPDKKKPGKEGIEKAKTIGQKNRELLQK
jgi:hypothetical protein